jgi:hypothetical protein
MATLTAQQIRDYLGDSAENNHLLDDVEFPDSAINLGMMLAVDSYNEIPPLGGATSDTLSNTLMLFGTLWHIYQGRALAIAARNQMSYSDGGLTVPIEERYQFYVQMAQIYESQFKTMAKDVKISKNMEAGWGSVSTDYATFPVW